MARVAVRCRRGQPRGCHQVAPPSRAQDPGSCSAGWCSSPARSSCAAGPTPDSISRGTQGDGGPVDRRPGGMHHRVPKPVLVGGPLRSDVEPQEATAAMAGHESDPAASSTACGRAGLGRSSGRGVLGTGLVGTGLVGTGLRAGRREVRAAGAGGGLDEIWAPPGRPGGPARGHHLDRVGHVVQVAAFDQLTGGAGLRGLADVI